MRFFLALGLGVLLLVLLLLVLAYWPQKAVPFEIRRTSVPDYETALKLIELNGEKTPGTVRADCHGRALLHGKPTPEVYVMMHGLTNCPVQFAKFGELLHAGGANVLIPRLPYHGNEDRLSDELSGLTGEQMVDLANLSIDAALGLGERVTVVGLSVNGNTAAWVAQNRPEVERVMVIAPFLAPKGVSPRFIGPLARLLQRLPNQFVWWDRQLQDQIEGPDHTYPRFATHPIAEVLRLGLDVTTEAETRAPVAKRIWMVSSESDLAVSLSCVDQLAALWTSKAPGVVLSHRFPASEMVPHDCMDPAAEGARVDLVYPLLLGLLGED